MQDAGVDVGSGILRERSWRWMQVRIIGLLGKPPGFTPDGRAVPSTRLGMAMNPVKPPSKQHK